MVRRNFIMKNAALVLLAFNLLLAGCASRAKPSPAATAPDAPVSYSPSSKIRAVKKLANTRWTVLEIEGVPAVSDVLDGWPAQSLEFDPDGRRVTGHGGVNRFGGRFEQAGPRLSFGPLAMTRRVGPAPRMEAEQRYTQALSRVVGWRQDGYRVVLIGSGGVRLVVLARVAK